MVMVMCMVCTLMYRNVRCNLGRAYHLSTMPPVQKVTGKDFIDKSLNDAALVPAILLNFFWVRECLVYGCVRYSCVC